MDYNYNYANYKVFENQTLNCKSLAGNWNYKIDRDDHGLSAKWQNKNFEKSGFIMPGTMAENALGDPLDIDFELSKDAVNRLRPYYKYIGVVWYQRKIRIPKSWENKRITLFLERVIFQSMVWIDDNKIGSYDSLSRPHIYDLSDYLQAGKEYKLTIRIDNRDIQDIGEYPSAYTDATQTIWNGIVGDIKLNAFDKLFIKKIQVYPNINNSKALVKIKLKNNTNEKTDIKVKLSARSNNTDKKHYPEVIECSKTIGRKGGELKLDYYLGDDFLLWDEFNPALYKLTIEVENEDKNLNDLKSTLFGMREFKTSKNRFILNNKNIFLRGTLDCCVYPLTGYPPTQVDKWMDIFNIIKSYGLNHLRFHSWCPPEAAFIAADLIGIYLLVEGPVWMDNWNTPVGAKEKHYDYLPEEALRIIEYYGNHPSFMMFSNGNEINGDFNLLHNIVKLLKEKDDRHLYTLTSNWDRSVDSADDFFISQAVDEKGIRGQYYQDEMVETTNLDFEEAISLRDIPVVSHEIGQYLVYPDITEISKFSGTLRPVNFEVIRDDLIDKKLISLAGEFTQASGKLAVQLYRDEIEASLKTKNMAGFQLLNLHDFPGQSTATVCILNSFWESKGLIEPEKFREFCGPIVLLLRMDKRIYTSKDKFNARIEIAHYGENEINDAVVEWTIMQEDNSIFSAGIIKKSHIKNGNNIELGEIKNISLADIKTASKLLVELKIRNTDIKNTWNIWVYPEANNYNKKEVLKEGDILVTSKINKKVESHLENGGNVLIMPAKEDVKEALPSKFYPVFWSPVHFESKDPCGIICDKQHDIFNDFPTASYSSYQWKNLLEDSYSIDLEALPENYMPIVTVVPNYFYNKKLGALFEANVKNGKIVVCTLNIKDGAKKNPEGFQLRKSILAYMSKDKYQPDFDLEIQDLKNLFKKSNESQSTKIKNIASGKKALSDSEASNHQANCGNDGLENTYWAAADKSDGHWWQVDLGSVCSVNKINIKFKEKKNYKYVIMFSQDNKEWVSIINETGQIDEIKIKNHNLDESRKARYIRIVYNNLPADTRASHYQFEVYDQKKN